MRYFVHDLESDKLHIFTGGKADWLTIPETDRNAIKRACLWSNSRGCWVSRGKAGRFWDREVLARNGFEDRGEQGERLTMAEQVEAKQEKAATTITRQVWCDGQLIGECEGVELWRAFRNAALRYPHLIGRQVELRGSIGLPVAERLLAPEKYEA